MRTGILGMNLRNDYEDSHLAFIVVTAGSFAIGACRARGGAPAGDGLRVVGEMD